MATVESIHIAPYASSPMRSLATATLIAGVGIEGDRYADNEGTYSVFRDSALKSGQPEPGRQLTILSADGAEKVLSDKGITIPGDGDLGTLRRNVVVRGVPAGTILSWIGKAVRLGGEGSENDGAAVVFVHRHCVPCMYNERRNGIPGLMEALWDEAGVSCEILVGGEVRVGHDVTVLSEEELREILGPDRAPVTVDGGDHHEGFYVRPSKRTNRQVEDMIERKRKCCDELEASDPDGVERLEMSYIGAGLSFWHVSKNAEGPKVIVPAVQPPGGMADPVTRTSGKGILTDHSREGRETRRSSDSGAHLFHWDDSTGDLSQAGESLAELGVDFGQPGE